MIGIKTATEVTDDVRQAEADANAEKNKDHLVTSLNQWVDRQWSDAKDAKRIIEQEMLDAQFQSRGQYTATKLAQIKAVEQPDIFMNITETKCRNGIAQIKDVISQPGKRIFSVNPPPLPELPPEIVQQLEQSTTQMFVQMAVQQAIQTGQKPDGAQIRQAIIAKADEIKQKVHYQINEKAKKMAADIEDKIDNDFLLGGLYDALDKVINDIGVLKIGCLKGPVFRKEKVKKSVQDPQTGKLSRSIEEKIVAQYERRSPFCIYPSPRSVGVNDGYLFDVIIIRPKDLYDLIGVDGFDAKEIRDVIKEFTGGQIKNDWLDLTPEAKEGFGEEDSRKVSTYYPYENIYCLELWDEIPGKLLKEWGMSEEDIPDEDDIYPVCVWQIGKHVIKAMLNYDKLGRKPFHITSFHKQNDSFFGRGIPEMIADCQQVCNACARAILSNVGIASFPMLDMNIDRLEPGASRKIWPGRVFPTTDEQMGAGSKALNFYQPQMVTQQLITVYETFSRIADEHSGVPAFSHGGAAVGGAGGTSSGLHQLREMAAQGIRAVIRYIDYDIITPAVEFHYDYLLDNTEVLGMVGDYKIVAEGSSALAAKEQLTMRKNEFLQSTSNPMDVQIIGLENRRKMLFDVAKGLGIEIDESVLTPMPPAQPQQQAQQGAVPQEKPTPADDAGNPTNGVDTRTQSPR